MFEALLFSTAVIFKTRLLAPPRFPPTIVTVCEAANPVPPLYTVTVGADEPSATTLNTADWDTPFPDVIEP